MSWNDLISGRIEEMGFTLHTRFYSTMNTLHVQRFIMAMC